LNKICSRCKKDLPTDDFCLNRASKDGFNSICRKCVAISRKENTWQRVRREVLERDNYQCVVCGSDESGDVSRLHVHHVVPRRDGGLDVKSNLVTLCVVHHGEIRGDLGSDLEQYIPDLQRCKRCGHKWTSRVSRPVRCPKCQSPYWNSDYVYKRKKRKEGGDA